MPVFETVPGNGAVSVIVGAELATETETADDVTEVPLESTATAVSVLTPAVEGVHDTEYGAVVTAAPIAAATPPGGVE